MMHGPRTVTYHVDDLAKAKSWYTAVLETEPYFDEDFYVGYDVEGFELGLMPSEEGAQPGPGGVVAYWGVDDIDTALARLIELGGEPHGDVEGVGGEIKVATVLDPSGNVFGIIFNPGL